MFAAENLYAGGRLLHDNEGIDTTVFSTPFDDKNADYIFSTSARIDLNMRREKGLLNSKQRNKRLFCPLKGATFTKFIQKYQK